MERSMDLLFVILDVVYKIIHDLILNVIKEKIKRTSFKLNW